jgi:Rps23 Pro-64 3,4-dihydroxylase Tpa1-like proline 4-hydroxylase
MNNLIYVNESLSEELCNRIISFFENEDNKNIGRMLGGIDLTHKNTTDFSIPVSNTHWDEINMILQRELQQNLTKYITQTKSIFNHNIFFKNKNSVLFEDCYNIQKYKKNEGFYSYHDDFHIDACNNSYRKITYIWYLNDVFEGGETELLSSILIKPKCGNILLFPACWTFPHRGKMPVSNDKYIITGWLYANIV